MKNNVWKILVPVIVLLILFSGVYVREKMTEKKDETTSSVLKGDINYHAKPLILEPETSLVLMDNVPTLHIKKNNGQYLIMVPKFSVSVDEKTDMIRVYGSFEGCPYVVTKIVDTLTNETLESGTGVLIKLPKYFKIDGNGSRPVLFGRDVIEVPTVTYTLKDRYNLIFVCVPKDSKSPPLKGVITVSDGLSSDTKHYWVTDTRN